MPQTQPYNPNPGGLNIQSGNDNQLQAPGFVGGQLNSSGTVNPATLQQASSAPLTPPQPGPSAAASRWAWT